MMLELVGSMASEPIDSEGWLSVIGVQFKPASIVFQTPPAAAPRKATSGFLGSTASAATRPELLGLPLKGNTPGATLIGWGCGLLRLCRRLQRSRSRLLCLRGRTRAQAEQQDSRSGKPRPDW